MLRLNPLMIVINGETNSSFGRVLGFNFTFRENDSTGDIFNSARIPQRIGFVKK